MFRFCYALAGTEGSAYDTTVLHFAKVAGFQVPADAFFLADAGFGLSPSSLTPYRGVRYHLREWASARSRPQNARELFNLRHARLRSLIERLFGAFKEKWQVLLIGLQFPDVSFQVDLIYALMMIWNFIQEQEGPSLFDDDEWWTFEYETNGELALNRDDDESAATWRDRIAEAMWADYMERHGQSRIYGSRNQDQGL